MTVKTRTFLALLWIFALAFWNMSLWQHVLLPKQDKLLVAFFDIGQGDAIFIQAPNGVQMLIDGGEDKGVIDDLKEILPRMDRSIDGILATHPDADHIGGLDDVLGQYKVSYIFDNGRKDKGTHTYENLEREIAHEISISHAQRFQAEHGMRIVLDKEKEVYFDIYYPTVSSTHPDSNELSIVGKLVYGETTFLLTGDAGIEVENKLLEWCRQCLQSDVLKVGHHGSKTSSGKAFLEAVAPQYAIISASKDNTYGHPHKDVMQRLENANAEIIQTAEKGTIIFESDGREVKIR